MEVILVDDGSSDGSGAICDEYAIRDSRIKVIHKENGGVSRARNTALNVITGDYVAFVDSDDTIYPEMLEKLYGNLIENNAEISVCDFFLVYPDKKAHQNPDGLLMNFNAGEAIETILLGREFQGHLCNKLFKAEVLEGLRFDEDIYVFEDMLYVIKAILKCKNVFFDSTPLYDYYMREGSALHATFNYRRYSAHTACLRILEEISNSDVENKESLCRCAYTATLVCNTVFLQKLYYDKASRREFCKIIRGNIKKYFKFEYLKPLSFVQKSGIVIARISTRLFFMFVPIKNKIKNN
jgi:glycosyltransferase involved in cell wall biosynthesis